jgi:hypothetical protein
MPQGGDLPFEIGGADVQALDHHPRFDTARFFQNQQDPLLTVSELDRATLLFFESLGAVHRPWITRFGGRKRIHVTVFTEKLPKMLSSVTWRHFFLAFCALHGKSPL